MGFPPLLFNSQLLCSVISDAGNRNWSLNMKAKVKEFCVKAQAAKQSYRQSKEAG